jgi:threonine aldolase
MPHVNFAYEPQANMIFIRLSRADHQKANRAGADYSLRNSDLDNGPADEILTARFVCDWSIEKHQIDIFLDIMRDI